MRGPLKGSSGYLKSSQCDSGWPRRPPPPLVSEGQVGSFSHGSMFGHYPFVANPSPCLSPTGRVLQLVNGANLTDVHCETPPCESVWSSNATSSVLNRTTRNCTGNYLDCFDLAINLLQNRWKQLIMRLSNHESQHESKQNLCSSFLKGNTKNLKKSLIK